MSDDNPNIHGPMWLAPSVTPEPLPRKGLEHSSIVDAEMVIRIALEAPVFAQADYDALEEMLDEAHATLRRVFVGGQTPGVPDDWRIDGLLFRDWDKRLVDAKMKLVQRYRATKFFAGQRRADIRRKDEKANIDGANWRKLHDYDQYMHAKQQGFDVRVLMVGKTTTYQYATLLETKKGKTQV